MLLSRRSERAVRLLLGLQNVQHKRVAVAFSSANRQQSTGPEKTERTLYGFYVRPYLDGCASKRAEDALISLSVVVPLFSTPNV